MSTEKIYVEKELSWLSFNERVLQEAADKSVPLIERIRFLGIFSNNLDEFYKVRFSDVKRRILINQEHKRQDKSKRLLSKMQSKAMKLNQKFDELYGELLLEMARRRIFLVNESQIDQTQQQWIKKFFRKEVLPHITPIVMHEEINVLDFLKDECAYLCVSLVKNNVSQYALLEIPTDHLPRFVMVPEQKGKRRKTIIFLDNVIRYCLDDIFSNFFEYDEINCYSMKMTRDAEYDLSYEVEHSLLEQMSEGLSQRLSAMPVRFVYEKTMPAEMLEFLCRKLEISNYDSLIPGGRYHNFKDFIGFPNVGRDYLENKPLPPLKAAVFENYRNSFDAIRAEDILLHYPYHTFDHISELVREASFDPKVISIKINIYRVAKGSRLMNSLIDAVNNGKSVTVVVELQARFDEKANILWSKRLTDAGVHVIFGAPGLKIHSKLLLINRREGEIIKRYAHIGTGNFHEKTARIYTDFSLLTAKQEITDEVRQVFGYIENPYRPVKFKQLIVSPRNSRERLYELIDGEIEHANEGRKSGITLKVNNLVDKGLINKLYQASTAGVPVRMIIRGMCSLVPGVEGVSDNIQVISVIDRFLEHPRVLITENGGDQKVYISSADWMTRNIENRIEVAAPINDPVLKQRIIDIIELQFTDTVKARWIDKEMSNAYVARGNRRKVRSQVATYNYIKQTEKQVRKLSEPAIETA
ncbi:polyphosphate kinase 1 [Vibrio sp. B1Z05]|uniref:polyphosphate kinase 1 n=1 Tax=Vibrio sp. B1Z05 TaxID=2654980 RepID=UPI00128D52FD|nr:polyphosphate kinase 1 [Vibrio sp. B1Z05]MPW37748.1 polyphosphate kinase 1 [Vibrio sp. B1Z05]